MSLQTTVNRAYTSGFAGQINIDGPKRAKAGRVNSATVGTDPAFSTNRMSRAFGYNGEVSLGGAAVGVAREALVIVGGAVFFGVLGNPNAQVLYGAAGNALQASMDLPIGAEGEFFDMATGIVGELFNETTASKTMTVGDQVAFVLNTITGGQNLQVLPYGALVSVARGSAAPAGMQLIPNAQIANDCVIGASAVGAPVSALTTIQLTQ